MVLRSSLLFDVLSASRPYCATHAARQCNNDFQMELLSNLSLDRTSDRFLTDSYEDLGHLSDHLTSQMH